MGDGLGASFLGDLDLAFGDEWPSDGRAEEIGAFVDRTGPEHGEDVIAHELFAQILDIDLFNPQHFRLGTRWLQLFALPQIGGEGDHFTLVMLLQPL